MSAYEPTLLCPCGWAGTIDELALQCYYPGNCEEPTEWIGLCPQCDGPEDKMEEVEID